MWDLIISVPDHCLSFTLPYCLLSIPILELFASDMFSFTWVDFV